MAEKQSIPDKSITDQPSDQNFGQHFIVCGECPLNAEFFCNSCRTRLCQRCKRWHHKRKSTRNHDVVVYRDKQTVTSSEICEIHRAQAKQYVMFCKDCAVSVCTKCITYNHNGHKLEEIDDVFQFSLDQCRDEISSMRDEVLKCQVIIEDMKLDASKYQRNASELRTNMKTRASEVKAVVDQILEENIKAIDEKEASYLSNLNTQEETMAKHISYLQNVIEDFEKIFEEKNPIKIILFHQQITQSGHDEIPKSIKPSKIVMTDVKIETESIRYQFGSIQEVDSEVKDKIPKATEVFKLDIPEFQDKIVFHVSCIDSSRAWISDIEGNLILIDNEKNQLEKIKLERGLVRGSYAFGYYTTNDTGELIFISFSERVIKKLDLKGEVHNLMSIKDGIPLVVKSSIKSGGLIIGVYFSEREKCAIFKYDNELHKTWESEHDFFNPSYITENVNGDIWITEPHCVETLNSFGQYKLTYGSPHLQRPSGICSDRCGNIYITSIQKSCIHVVDCDGNFLQYFLTKTHTLGRPFCVDVDNKNNLWVGIGSGCKYNVLVYRVYPKNSVQD